MAQVSPDVPAAPKARIAIVFYSMYGHVKKMAENVRDGINAAGGEGVLLQVPETLPADVLEKMHAAPKDDTIATANAADLVDYDGIIFGISTRFGMANAQMKSFMDSTGGLWFGGKLLGKPAGVFVCTGTQGGGQETTALTWITQLTHHGMIFVPMGYSHPSMMSMEEIHGGSSYGPGSFAGADGSRQPSEFELTICTHYGKHFYNTANALKVGRAALTPPAEA